MLFRSAKFKDQPEGYLEVGMNPIVVGGYARVFALFSDGRQLGLSANGNRPDLVWRGYDRFVFLRRK